jgi:hypothetical protein
MIGIEDPCRGARLLELEIGLRIYAPPLHACKVVGQQANAVRIDAAKAGPYEPVGHRRGPGLVHACRNESIANEALNFRCRKTTFHF